MLPQTITDSISMNLTEKTFIDSKAFKGCVTKFFFHGQKIIKWLIKATKYVIPTCAGCETRT